MEFKIGNFVQIDKECSKYGTNDGQYLVIAKVHDNAEAKLVALDLEVVSSEADAHVVSKHLVLLDEGKPIPAGLKRQYDRIMQAMLVVPTLKAIARGSWFHITTKWRDMAKNPEWRGEEAERVVVGQKVPQIAVIDGEECVILNNAEIDRLNADGSYTLKVADDEKVTDKKEFVVSKAALERALEGAPKKRAASTIDASSLTSDALKVLKQMPVTNACNRDYVSMEEIRILCSAAKYDVSRHPDDDDNTFNSYLLRSIKMLFTHASNADFTDLSAWSNVPSTLGKQLLKVGKGSKTMDLEDEDAPDAISSNQPSSSKAKYPLSDAAERLATNAGEWEKFLHASVTSSVSNPDKRADTKSSMVRSRAALERALESYGCTVARVSSIGNPKSMTSDELLCFLDSIEANQSPKQSSSWDSSKHAAPVGARPHVAKGDGIEAEVKLNMINAAASLIKSQASHQRLMSYAQLIEENKAEDAQRMLNNETDEHIIRLLLSPVDAVQTVLEGTVSNEISLNVLRIRKALDKRVEKAVMPSKDAEATTLESLQIRRARRGEFRKLKLLELINITDSTHTIEKPLHGFERRGATAMDNFSEAVNRHRDIISVAHPHEGAQAMDFFRSLIAKVKKAKERGATWQALSKWYAALARKVEEGSAKFAAGASDVRLLALNLDTELIESQTSWYARQLDEDIIDARQAARVTTKEKKRPIPKAAAAKKKRGGKRAKRGKKTDAVPPVQEDGEDSPDPDEEEEEEDAAAHTTPPPGDMTWGTYVPDKWGQEIHASFAEALAAKGAQPGTNKLPCGWHFKGHCDPTKRKGKECSFWHFKK